MTKITDYRRRRVMVFSVPLLYPSLNELLRMNPFVRARKQKQFELAVKVALKSRDVAPFPGPVRIAVDLNFPTSRRVRRDKDNYTAKWLLDSLVRAGILPDDNSRVIPEPVDVEFFDKCPDPRTDVRVEEI